MRRSMYAPCSVGLDSYGTLQSSRNLRHRDLVAECAFRCTSLSCMYPNASLIHISAHFDQKPSESAFEAAAGGLAFCGVIAWCPTPSSPFPKGSPKSGYQGLTTVARLRIQGLPQYGSAPSSSE